MKIYLKSETFLFILQIKQQPSTIQLNRVWLLLGGQEGRTVDWDEKMSKNRMTLMTITKTL